MERGALSEKLSNQKSRDYTLDIIRGITVFIMIAAHAIDYYHDASNDFLLYFVTITNTIAFTIFLFLSGSVGYIAYLKNYHSEKTFTHHIFKRVVFLLLPYYLLVGLGLSERLAAAASVDKLKIILNILSFRTVPSYTEFLIPFLFFSIAFLPLRKIMQKLATNWIFALCISILAYVIGSFCYDIHVPEFIAPTKAIFVGSAHMYRFPIFQYFPVYVFGLQWGHYLSQAIQLKEKKLNTKIMTLGLFGMLIIAIIPQIIAGKSGNSIFVRWPPSVPFILLGLSAVFLLFLHIYSSKEYRHHPFLRDGFLLLGQNAFALYCTHIALLKLYRLAGGVAVSSPLIVIGMFLMLLITSLALATFIPFNQNFHLTFIREGNGKPFLSYSLPTIPAIYQITDDISHRPKLHHRFAYVIIATGLFILTTSIFTATKEKLFAEPKRVDKWWNQDYSYERPIEIKNNQSFSIIKSGTPITLSVNHRQMVNEKKSLPNGNDVHILYYDGHDFQKLARAADNWNKDNTLITFGAVRDINEKKATSRYFLYYGNFAPDQVGNTTIKSQASNPTAITIKLGDEKKHNFFAQIGRNWYLKTDAVTTTEPLIFSIASNKPLSNTSTVRYEIIGTMIGDYMAPSQNEQNTWEAQVDVSSLPPGTYRIRAIAKDSKNKVNFSQNVAFNVSYPLYVTWTWDWEGYDVNQSYLNVMQYLSAKHHNIRLTHFFNPRIYTANNISPERQQYLTQWVKDRRDNNRDEINLHLHMFPDFVQDTGVTPRAGPRWGGDYGYDILTTAYNSEELTKMINKAKQYFELNGLGVPLAYRAGGWYANLDTLRAIQEAGLKIDSSARTKYTFGFNKTSGFWNVQPTERPYYPSLFNQNSANPGPNFSIMEIPNNGADSYAFSAKEMIGRFKMNFDGNPVAQKQQITFLSHPHWFKSAEQKRTDEVFTFIDQYYYDTDNGPVKYVTTGDVYNAFKSTN